MKTISIGAQSSQEKLAQAFANALAAEIGWTADENGNVKKDGINIYFRIYATSNYVYITASNSYTNLNGSIDISFSSSQTYNLYILESTDGSIAVGVGRSTDTPCLSVIITQNTAGSYVGMSISSSNDYIYTIRGIETANRTITLSTNTNNGVSTAVMRMADIWGAAMFNDIYYVVSCPYKNTDRVFYIGGKTYRSVGASDDKMYFALPERGD